MPEHVESVVGVGDRRVHRFQVVRERRPDDTTCEWVVVDVSRCAETDGREGAVRLATPDFEWTESVPLASFRSGAFEPVTAGGVPVWGY